MSLANGRRSAPIEVKDGTAKDGIAKDGTDPFIQRIETGPFLRRRSQMKPIKTKDPFELEIQIEELEPIVAPGGSETVLPLPSPAGHHHR